MIREHKKIRKGEIHEDGKLPRIDLNDPRHRNAFIIFTITTIIVLFLSTMGSFEAYHITESVEFCGTLCHQVMEPEHIGHLESEGCFRCHNDAFKAENGRVISRDCNLCHTIVGQGQAGQVE